MYKGPSVTHYGLAFCPDNLQRCWDLCLAQSQLSCRRTQVHAFNRTSRWKKRGIAMVPIKYGVAFAESFLNQVVQPNLA